MAAPEPITPPLGFTPAWIASFTPPAGTDRLELGDKHPRGRGLRIRFERKGPPTFRWKTPGTRGERLREADEAGPERLAALEAELAAWLGDGAGQGAKPKGAPTPGRTVKDVAED